MLQDTLNTDINRKLAAEDQIDRAAKAEYEELMSDVGELTEQIFSGKAGESFDNGEMFLNALQELVDARKDPEELAYRAEILVQTLEGYAEDIADENAQRFAKI